MRSLDIPESHMQGYIKTRSCSACVSAVEGNGCAQGGATKLKEYMRSLNILPQKRKRKASDGIPRSPRSPRSPDGLLPGDTDLPVTLNCTKCCPTLEIVRRQVMILMSFQYQPGHLITLGPGLCQSKAFTRRQGKQAYIGWWRTLQPHLKAAAAHATPACSPLPRFIHHESHI